MTAYAPQKVCTKCGERKPLDEFHRMSASTDGRRPSCKACMCEAERLRRETNPEHVRALAAVSREGRRDRIRQQDREWRIKNADKVREYERTKYERTKQDPIRMAQRREYARLRGMRAKYGLNEQAEEYGAILMGDPCAYCGAPAEHVDHIVPHAKGGEHEVENLTAACGSCNFRKGKGDLLRVMLRWIERDDDELLAA